MITQLGCIVGYTCDFCWHLIYINSCGSTMNKLENFTEVGDCNRSNLFDDVDIFEWADDFKSVMPKICNK